MIFQKILIVIIKPQNPKKVSSVKCKTNKNNEENSAEETML